MTVPGLISPDNMGNLLAADVSIIEISGADNQTALNGVYVSDGGSPPEYTHSTDSANTITYGTGLWEIQITNVSQWESPSIANTEAPVNQNINTAGDAFAWSVTGGTGPAVPQSAKRAAVPGLLTP